MGYKWGQISKQFWNYGRLLVLKGVDSRICQISPSLIILSLDNSSVMESCPFQVLLIVMDSDSKENFSFLANCFV